jgi:hypothetical protein
MVTSMSDNQENFSVIQVIKIEFKKHLRPFFQIRKKMDLGRFQAKFSVHCTFAQISSHRFENLKAASERFQKPLLNITGEKFSVLGFSENPKKARANVKI